MECQLHSYRTHFIVCIQSFISVRHFKTSTWLGLCMLNSLQRVQSQFSYYMEPCPAQFYHNQPFFFQVSDDMSSLKMHSLSQRSSEVRYQASFCHFSHHFHFFCFACSSAQPRLVCASGQMHFTGAKSSPWILLSKNCLARIEVS